MTRRDTVREGAAEVGAKLKSDISRWTKVRRYASIKPMMGCGACDATGRFTCTNCDGTGKTKFVVGDQPEPCHTCEGKGTVTCVDCAGRGIVPNVHRKKVLWVLVLGVLAWGFALYTFMDRDIAPGVIHGGSGGGQMSRPPNPLGKAVQDKALARPGSQTGTVIVPNTGIQPGNRLGQPTQNVPGAPVR